MKRETRRNAVALLCFVEIEAQNVAEGTVTRGNAEISATIYGEQLYQRRARRALPLLIRQAEAGSTIEYSDLADELGMPNPRNLNYVLDAIGNSLRQVSDKWGCDVPPLQCLVVSKQDGLPGEGVASFLNLPENFRGMALARKREVIAAKLLDIFAYPRWREVLATLNVPYIPASLSKGDPPAAFFELSNDAGNTDNDRSEKFIARPSSMPGIYRVPPGFIEVALPSGNVLDMAFGQAPPLRKPSHWPAQEIVRGIDQCVKYTAVLHAVCMTELFRITLLQSMGGAVLSQFESRRLNGG